MKIVPSRIQMYYIVRASELASAITFLRGHYS